MGQTKELSEGGGHVEGEEKNHNHGYCRIYDQTNELMVEARIKQMDADGKVFGNYCSASSSSPTTLDPHT